MFELSIVKSIICSSLCSKFRTELYLNNLAIWLICVVYNHDTVCSTDHYATRNIQGSQYCSLSSHATLYHTISDVGFYEITAIWILKMPYLCKECTVFECFASILNYSRKCSFVILGRTFIYRTCRVKDERGMPLHHDFKLGRGGEYIANCTVLFV